MASGTTQSMGTAAMSVVIAVVALSSRLDGTNASSNQRSRRRAPMRSAAPSSGAAGVPAQPAGAHDEQRDQHQKEAAPDARLPARAQQRLDEQRVAEQRHHAADVARRVEEVGLVAARVAG